MQTRHYSTRISDDGTVLVEGLPPNTAAEVIVLYRDPDDLLQTIDTIAETLKDHPFKTMSKEEISTVLRETREQLWNEQYGHLS